MERVFFITPESRTQLKKCFKDALFSLVPFEIWLDIISSTKLKIIFKVAQMCTGFKGLVDKYIKTNFRFALMCRQQLQMPMAKKCLELCAVNGNDPDAILHFVCAIESNGWSINPKTCFDFRSINSKGCHFKNTIRKYDMLCCCTNFIQDLRTRFIEYSIPEGIKQQLLEFDDPLISGYVYMCEKNFEMAKDLFLNKVSDNNKEFALILLANNIEELNQKNIYYTKAAHIGNVNAMRHLWYFHYKFGDDDAKHRKMSEKYRKLLELQDYKCIKIKRKDREENLRDYWIIIDVVLLVVCLYIALLL